MVDCYLLSLFNNEYICGVIGKWIDEFNVILSGGNYKGVNFYCRL